MTLLHAVFHDEVFFDTGRFAFLKHPPGQIESKGTISLKGAILEAAHLWGIDTLTRYDLRDAFVLGVSLAGKALVDCDFTGAVLKNVHTDGWQPDARTLANTAYIYTDYEDNEETEDDGTVRKVYRPKEDSRVPADGTFQDAGFTLADYFFEPVRWNRAVDLPEQIRQSFIEYLAGFEHYAATTRGLSVVVHRYPEGKRLRLQFEVREEAQRAEVEASFHDYIRDVFTPLDELQVEFRNPDLSPERRYAMLVHHKHNLGTLQARLLNDLPQLPRPQAQNSMQQIGSSGNVNNFYFDMKPIATALSEASSTARAEALAEANATAIAEVYPEAANDLEEAEDLIAALDDLDEKERARVIKKITKLRGALEADEPDPSRVKRFFKGLYNKLERVADQGENADKWAGAIDKIVKVGQALGYLGKAAGSGVLPGLIA